MTKVFLFIAGTSAGFYLAQVSLSDMLPILLLIGIGLPLLIIVFMFHLGVCNFQEFEHNDRSN